MDEIWKPITEYEGLYEVSNLGRVRSLDRIVRHSPGKTKQAKGQIIKPINHNLGYLVVGLANENKIIRKYIHRLVGLHFLTQYSEGQVINHIDTNKRNNVVSNLEWCDAKQNAEHAVNHGRYSPITNRLVPRKLTLENVEAIRQARQAGVTLKVLAKQFGIDKSTVGKVANFKIWKPAVTELSVK